MEHLTFLIDIFLHIDDHLSQVIQNYGFWTYLFLFVIIFLETGVVVTPFLPGDSLLFAVGTFTAIGALDLPFSIILLIIAAVLGDTVNYTIGAIVGPKVFSKDNSRFFKKKYLEDTQKFYEKYGTKTIILARFVPIIRTFAPFVAGIGRMKYSVFITYNIVGAVLWVVLCVFAGYFLGNIPIVKENFSIAILVIIFISILPVILEVWKHQREKTKNPSA
ncbi:MAG: DedA family protein [Candidatus Omnitrophica bacterium]|nr:DedA family protein [Candidatus Omnitrophota bacterium]